MPLRWKFSVSVIRASTPVTQYNQRQVVYIGVYLIEYFIVTAGNEVNTQVSAMLFIALHSVLYN